MPDVIEEHLLGTCDVDPARLHAQTNQCAYWQAVAPQLSPAKDIPVGDGEYPRLSPAMRAATEALYTFVIRRDGHAGAGMPENFMQAWTEAAQTIVDAYLLLSLEATPDLGTLDNGEEGEQTATCRHCGGPLFMDFIEVPDDRWRIQDETCFWQHNDGRYMPGAPSLCGPPEKWEAHSVTERSEHIAPIERRFWEKVDQGAPEDCWLWTGSTRNGYGTFWVEGRVRKATHMALFIAHGRWPVQGEKACHRCDVPLCVNPGHLFFGTQKDNMADCAAKGRLAIQLRPEVYAASTHKMGHKGEKNGRARLTAEQVGTIRSRYAAGGETLRSLAAEFGVHNTTIGRIIKGSRWTA